ncbi:hypothetical protein GQ53DRAFT_872520 [Thozetella sp. PMI_491]|nr:hypothetical protein GQ53DRAFT_872520 [Thozetella sp. PMI_491]
MTLLRRVSIAVATAALCLQGAAAQMLSGNYTEKTSGIQFQTWYTEPNVDPDSVEQTDYTWGVVLPETALTTDANEYIGIMRCSITNVNNTGWCGLSHGASGQMTSSLLLMAWPYNGEVYTSFRYTPGYQTPPVYTGNATLTQISSFVNATMWELVYRCQNCFSWNQNGATGKVSTSSKFFLMGRAAAKRGPYNAQCPDKMTFGFHDHGYGQYGAQLDNATHTSYSAWAALATKTVATDCDHITEIPKTTSTPVATPTGPSTPETPTPTCTLAPDNKTYDYIVVGAGAAGIPIADKLSQAGKSVLLLERGPPSTGRWNGTMKPQWLQGTNLTRFDVPGLANQIWHDSTGIACTDTDQMEGCVLGGGTAVNAGLWWKPNPKDWDYNFPAGWRSTDVADATRRVFERIPGTWHPSMDGQLYKQEGFDVIASGLNSSGYSYLIPNDNPTLKNRTYGHTTYMYSNGERGGPLATYLVSAHRRKQFTLFTNTEVKRLTREGGHITGVELGCIPEGYTGSISVTNGTGRVILAGGTFGTARILMRSGIGPTDQIETVRTSFEDGFVLTPRTNWIDLPVGYNLMDHLNTDLIIAHPNVSFYDFYAAWDKPIESDKDSYLQNRTGILAQAAPNIGPMIWDEIKGSDGIVRQLQWTSRVEGDDNVNPSKFSMTMSQYLGRGVVSRGRTTINPSLSMEVSLHPYLHNDFDKEAVIQGIKNVKEALSHVQNLTWIKPKANQSVESFVDSLPVSPGSRRSNHWMGTAKMGTDDGRTGGTSVVDLNARVYGTDNLFVVDASIFPGMPTGNPSAMIVIAAEHASQKILSLPAPRPIAYGQQCGGKTWGGSFTCQSPYSCVYVSKDFSACVSPDPIEYMKYIQEVYPEEYAKHLEEIGTAA